MIYLVRYNLFQSTIDRRISLRKSNFFYFLQVYALIFLITNILIVSLENNKLTLFILLFSVILFLIGSIFTNDDRINILIMFFLVSGALQIFPDASFISSNVVPLFIILIIIKLIVIKRYVFRNMRYLLFILVFFIIAIFSAFNASNIFQQSYFESLIPNRDYFVLLAYVPLLLWFRKGYDLEKLLVIFTLIASSLFILQYLLVDQVQFLSFTIQERLGARLRLSHPIIYLGALVSLNYFIVNFSKNTRYKWIGLYSYITTIFLVLFVNQTRSIFLALILCGLVILGFSNVQTINKVKITFGIILLLLFTAPFYSEQISGIIQSTIFDINNSAGNLEVRQEATNYYVQLGKSTPFLGHGYINLRTSNEDLLLSGLNSGFYWVDIGIFGLFFLHGIFGVFWYLLVIMLILLNSKLIIKKQKTYIFAAAIYNIITITLLADFYSFLFSTAFCLAALNYINSGKRTNIISEVT